MDSEKIGKWVMWIAGALIALVGYWAQNPHPAKQPGVFPPAGN